MPGQGHDPALDEVGKADEIRHEPHRRRTVDLHRRSLLDDPALFHDGDDIGHRERFELIVGHVDGGDPQAFDQIADLGAGLLAQLGVEVRQGLVQQQDLGLAHQRPGEGEALLLAAREERRRPGLEPAELHQLERA